MNKRIIKRIYNESNYIIKTDKTIREVAKEFKVSKSTVHKDLNERLLLIDEVIYNKVANILKQHLNIRHIRGGESTKRKYLLKNTN